MKLKFKSFFGDRRGLSIFIFPALLLLSFTAFTAGCSGEGFDADDEVPESDPFTSSNSNSLRAYPIPHNGSPISMESGDRKIVITFTRSMNTNSLQLGGDLVEESFLHTWSSVYRDNDTLTVTPASGYVWSPGINKTIIIACDDINGSALDTLKLNYHIAGKFIYVREDGTSTAPGGTAALPLDTIQAAIDKANQYDAVIVGGGTYAAAATVVALKEGVSLYGGFSYSDWDIRNTLTFVSTIEDTRTSGSSLSTITGDSTISGETVIDGFTIKAANYRESEAIFNNSASPTIRNNVIIGGSISSTGSNYCIRNESSASPLLEANTIISGSSTGSSSYICYGIYHNSTAPLVVRNNILTGPISDTAHASCAIRNLNSQSVTIRNNTFYGSGSYVHHSLGFAFTNNLNTGTITIENNIILAHSNVQICAIWQPESTNQVSVISMRNNNFYSFNDNSNWKLYQSSTATFSSINEMETHINSLSGSIAGSNISVDPNFVDIDGFDNDITTIGNNDWTLSAESDSRLREGGLNGAHPNEEWEYVFDIDNNFRSPLDSSTTGWSMGAYEYFE